MIMKIYNTIQNSGTVMNFLVQNLKIKSSEQLKHRNIMNEIYGLFFPQILPPLVEVKERPESEKSIKGR